MSAMPIQDQARQVDALVSKVNELAVLPHVVYKVLEIAGSTDSPASEIEKAIVVDPGFCAKLLTHANSAYYGLPRQVTSIREAIVFLGFKAVRQMAMTVACFDLFVGKNDKESLRRRAWWRHSIDTAVCSKYIAQKTKRVTPEEAYTCGLLHIIGKTLLDRYAPGAYERVESLIASGVQDYIAEQQVYGCDHVRVGMAAATKWGLPENLVEALNYTDPKAANDPFAPFSATVALSTVISRIAITGTHEELPIWACEALEFSEAERQELIDAGMEVIAAAATIQM
ncbi:MAG TPA: HDOD domain-containing protein [Fimbriimonadaceae bacterium]|nr:HDOD domain-containing protein [Fimbriimonadaceae bacterium]